MLSSSGDHRVAMPEQAPFLPAQLCSAGGLRPWAVKQVQVCILYKQAHFSMLITDPIHKPIVESKRQKEQCERQ